MGDQSPVKGNVCVFCHEERLKLYLHYFFHLVFGHQAKFTNMSERIAEIATLRKPPDLLVLAPRLFDSENIALIKTLVGSDGAPFVLCLKSAGDETPNEALFEAGAQEVLTCPFSLKELAYRLRSRAKEIGISFDIDPDQAQTLDLTADITRRANLTDIEAQVMLVLMEGEGGIVTRDALSLAIDNQPWNYGNRKFDVHIAKIRKKLNTAYGGDFTLRTVRSAGYQLTVSPGV